MNNKCMSLLDYVDINSNSNSNSDSNSINSIQLLSLFTQVITIIIAYL